MNIVAFPSLYSILKAVKPEYSLKELLLKF